MFFVETLGNEVNIYSKLMRNKHVMNTHLLKQIISTDSGNNKSMAEKMLWNIIYLSFPGEFWRTIEEAEEEQRQNYNNQTDSNKNENI